MTRLFPTAVSRLEQLRIDAHPGYPSLGFLNPVFDGSLPKLQSLQLQNVPFWSMGIFQGLRHLEFTDGAQTLPLFIPLILDVHRTSPPLETLFTKTRRTPPPTTDTRVTLPPHPIHTGSV